ncbi:hypothetical protein A4R35_00195 [Thermogemmatispora tikiterensis]|uniref:Uncharacterized protein n=1 Tax=Thermogemmatispora tikiterensis TaxID=1825093 RepID=A0A328VDV8_9CHLR|nr:hypothetical protein A4R35_00195 [Thermogemmatispora tikiterensis]
MLLAQQGQGLPEESALAEPPVGRVGRRFGCWRLRLRIVEPDNPGTETGCSGAGPAQHLQQRS